MKPHRISVEFRDREWVWVVESVQDGLCQTGKVYELEGGIEGLYNDLALRDPHYHPAGRGLQSTYRARVENLEKRKLAAKRVCYRVCLNLGLAVAETESKLEAFRREAG